MEIYLAGQASGTEFVHEILLPQTFLAMQAVHQLPRRPMKLAAACRQASLRDMLLQALAFVLAYNLAPSFLRLVPYAFTSFGIRPEQARRAPMASCRSSRLQQLQTKSGCSRAGYRRMAYHLDLPGGQAIHRQLVRVVSGLVGEIDQVVWRAGANLDDSALISGVDAVLRYRVADAHDVEQAWQLPLGAGRSAPIRGRRLW